MSVNGVQDSMLSLTANLQPQKSYNTQKQRTSILHFEKALMDLFLSSVQRHVDNYKNQHIPHHRKQLKQKCSVDLCHTFSAPQYYFIKQKLSTRVKEVYFVLFVKLRWEQLYPGDWSRCQVKVDGSMDFSRQFCGRDTDWSDLEYTPNASQKQLMVSLETKLKEMYDQYLYSSLESEIGRKVQVNDLVTIVLHYLLLENQSAVA